MWTGPPLRARLSQDPHGPGTLRPLTPGLKAAPQGGSPCADSPAWRGRLVSAHTGLGGHRREHRFLRPDPQRPDPPLCSRHPRVPRPHACHGEPRRRRGVI